MITGTIVSEGDRLNVIPRHFGRYFTVFEANVFGTVGGLFKKYTGGYWEFVELSNGGMFMYPLVGYKKVFLENNMNMNSAELSPRAAGVAVCLIVLSGLSFEYPDSSFAKHYCALRDYAYDGDLSDSDMAGIAKITD